MRGFCHWNKLVTSCHFIFLYISHFTKSICGIFMGWLSLSIKHNIGLYPNSNVSHSEYKGMGMHTCLLFYSRTQICCSLCLDTSVLRRRSHEGTNNSKMCFLICVNVRLKDVRQHFCVFIMIRGCWLNGLTCSVGAAKLLQKPSMVSKNNARGSSG